MVLNEMDYLLLSKPDLSDNSKRTYKKNYQNLSDLMQSDMINEETQEDLYNKISKLENANTQQMYINIAMMIKQFHNNRFDYLKKKRDLIRDNIKQNRNEKKTEKKNDLPDYKDLEKHIREMLSDNNYKAYIINYLMTEYSTRNKDLDIIITDDIKEYRKLKKAKNENILFVNKTGKNYYVRNNYKTSRTYGELIYNFNNKKFNNAVKEYIKEEKQKGVDTIYLLSKTDGSRMTEDSIAHHIMRYTLNGMSESDVNKISVSRIKDMDDYPLLKKISERRPTSIPTLVEEYHLDIKI